MVRLGDMAAIRIEADFNSVDYKGRIILGKFVEEFMSEEAELKEGLHVILWDRDGEVEAVLEFEKGSNGVLSDMLGGRSGEKGSWRARLIPATGITKKKHRT